MAEITEIVAGPRWKAWRILMWGGAAALLLTPAVAMQFSSQFDWDETDFLFMGVMLAVACTTCELAARASRNGAYRMAVAVAVGVAFLTVWANLAVGMIRSEDNPYNLLFGGVIGLALIGAMAARFAASGMARAMLVAAAAQAAAAAVGLSMDMRGGIFSMIFALPWLLSAWLFARAARQSD
jgi:hypothetical protein